MALEEQRKNIAQDRKSQVGSGDRSEKIRTYNFPQNRMTDHRIGLTLHQLDSIMDGQLKGVIEPLITYYTAEKLKMKRLIAVWLGGGDSLDLMVCMCRESVVIMLL